MRVTHSGEQRAQTPEGVFGELVKEAREAVGLSQQGLGDKLREVFGVDLSQTALTRLERGQRPIRLNEVHALAHLLRIDLSRFSGPTQVFAASDYEQAPARLAELERELAQARALLDETRARIRGEEREAEGRVAWLDYQVKQLRRSMEDYERRLVEKGRAG